MKGTREQHEGEVGDDGTRMGRRLKIMKGFVRPVQGFGL